MNTIAGLVNSTRISAVRALLRTAVVAAASLSMLVGTTSASEAATWQSIDGRPGSVQLPQVQGVATQLGSSELRFPARYVWRSPSSTGAQSVVLFARVWHYAGGQYLLEKDWYVAATIPAGAPGVWLPAMRMTPRNIGDYTLQVYVHWRTLGGTSLGNLFVDENAASDYVCAGGESCYCDANRRIGGRGSIWLFA